MAILSTSSSQTVLRPGNRVFNGGLVGTTPFVGSLDGATSNLAAAWSWNKRLLSSWTSGIVRCRTSAAGNAEQDIGTLSNGSLDTASELSFLAGNTGTNSKCYDQSGGGLFLSAAAANQPLLASGGVAQDGVQFDGSNYAMDTASISQSVLTDGTNIQVLAEVFVKNPPNDGRFFDFGPDQISTWLPFSGTVYWDAPYPAARISAATPSGIVGSWAVVSFEREGTTARVRVNGTVAITGTVSGTISATSVFRVGATTSGSSFFLGNLRNLIIWKDCVNPATRAALLS